MSDDDDDVDPANPQPKSHYGRLRDSPWHYVNDELAQTFILGPATDAESGDNWILSFTEEGTTEADRERMYVRPASRVLHESCIKMKDLSPGARQAGHTVEYDLYGESVPLEKAIPNKRGELVHKRCCVSAYGGSVQIEGY